MLDREVLSMLDTPSTEEAQHLAPFVQLAFKKVGKVSDTSYRRRRSRDPWFDRLTVLSKVEGLTTLSRVEGVSTMLFL